MIAYYYFNEVKGTLDFKTGKLFPWHFQVMAAVMLLVGVVLSVDHTLISIILIVVSLIIFTGSSGIELNAEKNKYREYLSFLFIKTGRMLPFPGAERMYVNRVKVSQKMYTAYTSQSSVFSSVEFDAYLKLANGDKIHLHSNRNKDKLMRVVTPLASYLNMSIDDNTL